MSLREDIRIAIYNGARKAHERWPEDTPEPCADTAGVMADEVVAMLISRLTGQRFEAHHRREIGQARYKSDGQIYD